MFVNKQRRDIISHAIAGTIGAFAGSQRTQVARAEERPKHLGLPANVGFTHTWLALRFAHQGPANTSMLAPILPGRKSTSVDDALRYGIFCNSYTALKEYMYLGKEIKFQGAVAAVEQPHVLFEDFKLANPAVDVPQRAKEEQAEYCRLCEKAGDTPEEVARQIAMYGLTRRPKPNRESLWAFKFRGQTQGTAGFAIDSSRSEHLADAIAMACIFRNLEEIRLWRLHQINVSFLLGSFDSPDGWDLRYGCCFTKEELGEMPLGSPNR